MNNSLTAGAASSNENTDRSLIRVRNMVYANKKEREAEKSVCSFIVNKVLNQGKLTKITGIATKDDFDKRLHD